MKADNHTTEICFRSFQDILSVPTDTQMEEPWRRFTQVVRRCIARTRVTERGRVDILIFVSESQDPIFSPKEMNFLRVQKLFL